MCRVCRWGNNNAKTDHGGGEGTVVVEKNLGMKKTVICPGHLTLEFKTRRSYTGRIKNYHQLLTILVVKPRISLVKDKRVPLPETIRENLLLEFLYILVFNFRMITTQILIHISDGDLFEFDTATQAYLAGFWAHTWVPEIKERKEVFTNT